MPYEWYTNSAFVRFKGYNASVFYSYFAGRGFNIETG